MSEPPLAYLITVRTYGTWLHGDGRTSIDKDHNIFGDEPVWTNPRRENYERDLLKAAPVLLTVPQRTRAEATIREVCQHRGWRLHAVNARTNHVHVVLSCVHTPERAMNDLKSWMTRRLVEAGLHARGADVWARHGSTKYLWDQQSVEAAVDYVNNQQ